MSDIQQLVSLIVEDHRIDVEKSLADLLTAPPVKLTIDGRQLEVPATTLGKDPITAQPVARPTSIYDAALKLGIKVPVLCHREHMTPVAVCRFCVVELGYADDKDPSKINWQPRLVPACQRQVEKGMHIRTAVQSERVTKSVKVLTQLLLADHDTPREVNKEYGDNELRTIAKHFGLPPHESPFPRTARDRGQDESSLIIAVDHNACILCDRCVRGCNEIRNNQVIGRMGKGYRARIAFDLNNPMGESSCVSCGECMVSCPTGALTNRKSVETIVDLGHGGAIVKTEDLYKNALFEGVSRQFLGWNEGAIVRRKYKAGEILCREGEFGNSAFIIEEGELEVYIASPLKHAKAKKGRGDSTRGGFLGLFQKFASKLVGRAEDRRDEESPARYIPVDAPETLDFANPVATLTPRHLIFGEMSCMNNYPRAASVRAKTDVTVLEILRNVLYILQRNKKSKAKLDAVYRDRALSSHLRSVPIFAGLMKNEAEFKRFVEDFKARMSLVRLNPGELIFRQGDLADSFYLVRVGFVKVSQRQRGGEHVLSYIGPGGYFGEIGLLSDMPEIRGMAPPGIRIASCSALDHVDLVKISGVAFHEILTKFPAVRDQVAAEARKRLEENESSRRKNENVTMGEFVKQGLMNAQSLLVLDLTKCTRCDECTKACADAHDGVTRLIREGLRFENWLVASSCRSCLDPYCMVGCPVDSIHRKKTREMIIEDWCIGCGNCAKNCPYGNINMHPFATGDMTEDPDRPGRQIPVVQQKATMCDLCSDLDGQPSCVYACPHDAAHRYSGDAFRDLVAPKN